MAVRNSVWHALNTLEERLEPKQLDAALKLWGRGKGTYEISLALSIDEHVVFNSLREYRERKRVAAVVHNKRCSDCDREFPATLEHFARDMRTWDQLTYRCRKCRATAAPESTS